MKPERRASERRTAPTRRDEITREEALALALDNLPIGVGLFHMDALPVFMNRRFMDMFGVPDGYLASPLTFMQAAEGGHLENWRQDPAEYFRRLTEALRQGRDYEAELGIGERVYYAHNRLIGERHLLATIVDITERVQAERRVAHLAHHDPLTDLPNRAAFAEKLAGVMEEARARGQKFAVLSADLDRFKDVNDIFGHGVGDALLREVAHRFRRSIGDNFLARLGGDEFTFISLDANQPEAAGVLARRLFASASGEVECAGHTLMVGLSIGIAIFPDDGADAATLLNNADAALYRAKSDGRGVIRSFAPQTDQRIREQRLLQQELRLAVPRGELALHYQPQSRVDGEFTGFEALLRWQHPTRGLLMPDQFIALAEENGLIVEIGEWVLREAAREAAGWARPLVVSVNLSPVQFRHGDLPALIHAILIETGLPASRLEVEITEGVLVDDFARAIAVLRRIKALGVHVAMDDFGIGYSSLSYLQAFPFDTLKIDRSFIARLGSESHTDEIVRAVIGLGRGLRLPIVAEGVETPEQLAFLAGEHCAGIQGYLIGRPRPIADYAEAVGRPHAARRRRAAG
ncbi:MAG: GGDEF domain-containing protein [Alphaproteobacteria bacterium]|nr:MAG: GGDEF domain-containing protein [Alphaproteobacteria bacterium]